MARHFVRYYICGCAKSFVLWIIPRKMSFDIINTEKIAKVNYCILIYLNHITASTYIYCKF